VQILCKCEEESEEEKHIHISADVSMVLDVRRAKKDSVYPIKLRVYYQAKAVLYPTVFSLTQEDYGKLTAKKTSDRLMEIRNKLDGLQRQAKNAADAIAPFDFEKFFIRFVYEHRLFIQKKKKLRSLPHNHLAINHSKIRLNGS
jgi:integrase/recombinase XerD